MSDSILTSTKKVLGIEAAYTAFDVDITMHINSIFSVLTQLGVGPVNGFMISDAVATWDQFLGVDRNLNSVKTYMFLRVRVLFDPPTTPFLINAMQEQIKELEWRLNAHREELFWVAPAPRLDPPSDILPAIDGGTGF